jgi:hypothetical protein
VVVEVPWTVFSLVDQTAGDEVESVTNWKVGFENISSKEAYGDMFNMVKDLRQDARRVRATS